ncbi:MAG: MATE family efflux transporter [Firmicutes bacterium]|nr:MATE family efflux transporter [Bacillota bacterium]
MKTDWLVRDKEFYKKLFLLALPMAGQSILTFAVGLADNIMVGRVGDLALSGVYMANQWMTMLQQFIHGFMTAALVIATQYWGKKDTDSIKTILAITARFAAVTGLLFFIAAFFFPIRLMGLYTDDPVVAAEAGRYIRIVAWSYLFYVVTELLMTSLKSVETVGIALYTSISTLIINVVLNYLLIFGHLGFPAMGVRGAAVATLAARVVETGIMLYYVKFRDKKLSLRLSDFARRSKVLLKDYIRYGIPIFAGAAVWGINMTGQGAIIGRLGQSAISAISISNNMFQIVSVGVYGVASATAIIIGKTVGSGDYELVKKYAKTLQLVFVAMGLSTAVLMYASHWLIPLMYPTASPETASIVDQLILVLTVMVIGTAYQMSSLTGIVRAGGLTHFVFVNDTIFVCFVVLPLGFLSAFVLHAPVWVVFACLKCDQILKCFVALVKVNRFKWIKNITR